MIRQGPHGHDNGKPGVDGNSGWVDRVAVQVVDRPLDSIVLATGRFRYQRLTGDGNEKLRCGVTVVLHLRREPCDFAASQ